MRFNMSYYDVPKMHEIYPFLSSSSNEEVLMLLEASLNDKEFADACRLELMWRSKQKETSKV